LSVAKKLDSLLFFGEALLSAGDTVNAILGPLDVALSYSGPPPVPAGQPPSGDIGPVTSGDALPAHVLLKRAGSIASYYLDPNRVAHPITDGGIYICLARYMPTWFGVDDTEWADVVHAVGSDATCPPAPDGLMPRSLQPSSTHNFLLLNHNEPFGWYYVRSDGIKVRVFDDEPSCLFDHTLVWDWASWSELYNFQFGRRAHDAPHLSR
jgi:hypothetical protein